MPEWAETLGALIVGLVAAWLQYRGKRSAIEQGEQAAKVIHAIVDGVERVGDDNLGAARLAKGRIQKAATLMGVEEELAARVKDITRRMGR